MTSQRCTLLRDARQYKGWTSSSAINSRSGQAKSRAGWDPNQAMKAWRGCFRRLPSCSSPLADDGAGERDILNCSNAESQKEMRAGKEATGGKTISNRLRRQDENGDVFAIQEHSLAVYKVVSVTWRMLQVERGCSDMQDCDVSLRLTTKSQCVFVAKKLSAVHARFISRWKYRFSSDQRSQATLSLVSTDVGDQSGTLSDLAFLPIEAPGFFDRVRRGVRESNVGNVEPASSSHYHSRQSCCQCVPSALLLMIFVWLVMANAGKGRYYKQLSLQINAVALL
jgi:hypothetical protein